MLLLIYLSNGGLSSKNLGLRVGLYFENRATHDIGDVSGDHEIRLGNWHQSRLAIYGG